jgi:hypothetical protein
MLIIHVIIALTSILLATASLVAPSRNKLRINYGFIAATVVSGTAMVVVTQAPMLSSCMSGLSYLAVAVALSVAAEYRLSKAVE